MTKAYSVPAANLARCISALRFTPGLIEGVDDTGNVVVELTCAGAMSPEDAAQRKSDPKAWATVDALMSSFGGVAV